MAKQKKEVNLSQSQKFAVEAGKLKMHKSGGFLQDHEAKKKMKERIAHRNAIKAKQQNNDVAGK